MNILLVSAHPKRDSFTHQVIATYLEAARSAGHTVHHEELYESDFAPVLTAAELDGLRSGLIPPDVVQQQAQLAAADQLVLVYPIWWAMPPALLVGWLQRILTDGFAFAFNPEGQPGRLLIPARVIATIGAGQPQRGDANLDHQYFDPIEGVLKYCGMTVLPHLALWGANARMSEVQAQGYLAQVADAARAGR